MGQQPATGGSFNGQYVGTPPSSAEVGQGRRFILTGLHSKRPFASSPRIPLTLNSSGRCVSWWRWRSMKGPNQRYWISPSQRSDDTNSPVRASILGAFRSGDQVLVSCAPGWHFHPPLNNEEALLTCSANSLWEDVSMGGVQRCLPDTLICPWPLIDAGYRGCSEPLPVVQAVSVVTAMANRIAQPSSPNAGTVLQVPNPENVFNSGQLMLHIAGQWLTDSSEVFVSSQQCTDVRLRNVSRYCWEDASGQSECRDFASGLLCLMSRQVGVRDAVSVTTGRDNRRRTIQSIRLSDSVGGVVPLTVSVVEPKVVSLREKSGLCRVSPNNPASLLDCAQDQGDLQVELCGTDFRLSLD